MNEKIDKLKVRIASYTNDPVKSMWVSARNCYFRGGFDDLEQTYNEDKAVRFLHSIYKRGHLSIFEHPTFQYKIEGASRSLLAQLTRHRVGWSYAVQSQHYQKHNDFHYKELEEYIDEDHKKEYYKLMDKINTFYKNSLDKGIPRYIAREVLPNSTSVHMVASANLTALDHFWKLRKGKENTPEIRDLSNQLYEQTKIIIPKLEDIIQYGGD